MKMIDKNIKNVGINTEYCFDYDGADEFKCECNQGFDGKRCEDECSLECNDGWACSPEFNDTSGTKRWKCIETCELNPCEELIKIIILFVNFE